MFNRVLMVSAAAMFAATAANAQTVGLGSTKSSMVAAMTTAISNVVSGKTILKMRRQVMGGTQKYIPVVNAGELEFAVSNMVQYAMAVDGRQLSKRKYDNLRLVATLMRFRTGLLVKNDSGIKTVADLKGKRFAYGFKGAPLFDAFARVMLGTAGINYDKEVKRVPAVGLAQHWNLFKQGKVDGVIAGVGGGPNKDMNAKISSGVRYLSFPTDTADAKKWIATIPGGVFEEVKAAKPYVAVRTPSVVLIGYDFMLFTNKNVPEKTVAEVAKAMVAGVKDFHAVSPVWRTYNEKRAQKDQGAKYPYHAGAIKAYKELGLWSR
jgi:TRAP transporter TAXI family solute receptor